MDFVEETMQKTEAEIYDKHIQKWIKPYSWESIGIGSFELVHLGYFLYDSISQNIDDFEYESIEEPIRPKIDRWASRNCPVHKVDRIEYSDFDLDDINMFANDTFGATTNSPEKLSGSPGVSIISKKSILSNKQSFRSHSKSTVKFKSLKISKKNSSNDLKPEGEDVEIEKPPEHPQIPLEDLPQPREIPIEEKLLRDRKEKQKANQLKKDQELQARVDRENEIKKALQKSQSNTDIKNKKITYDHNGKVLMIKTVSEKK